MSIFKRNLARETASLFFEAYSLNKSRWVGFSQTSFPHRDIKFNAVAIPWYNDTSLDGEAEAFGSAQCGTVEILRRVGPQCHVGHSLILLIFFVILD